MAVTAEKSTQVTNMEATPPVRLSTRDHHGRTRIAAFTFTQGAAAGDAGSTMDLVKLPAGKVRVLKTGSVIVFSAFGAARVLDVGYTAFTKSDGTTQAASVDTIHDGANVAAAGSVVLGAGTNGLGTSPFIDFDSRDGVTIQAKVGADTIPAGATLNGYISYVLD